MVDPNTLEANWTKAYVGMHSIEYRGVYNHKNMSGVWTLRFSTGDFRIWPGASEEGQEETAQVEIEDPAELVLV